MTRKLTALMAAAVLVVPVAATGCGGGDDNGGGGGKGTLSTQDNLKVDQDRADIEEFCSVAPVGKGDLYDRAFFSVVAAVDDLTIIYKKNSDDIFYEPIKKRNIKMKLLVEDLARKLNGCGKDGKQQSQELSNSLQS